MGRSPKYRKLSKPTAFENSQKALGGPRIQRATAVLPSDADGTLHNVKARTKKNSHEVGPVQVGPPDPRAQQNALSPAFLRMSTTDLKANQFGISSPARNLRRNSVPLSLTTFLPDFFAMLSCTYPSSGPT